MTIKKCNIFSKRNYNSDIDGNKIIVNMFNYLTKKNMFFSKGETEITDNKTMNIYSQKFI